MLFKPFHKSSVLKTYLKVLPLALKKRYGKHKRYTMDQINETIELVGLDTEYIHYAYAVFLSHSDFKALDKSQNSDREYSILRSIIGKKYFKGKTNFTIHDILNGTSLSDLPKKYSSVDFRKKSVVTGVMEEIKEGIAKH